MSKRNNILKIGGKNLDGENWKVYHPDGTHMFTCGGKKARWYLDRDLAIEIGDNKIQFNFEPNGYGFADNEEFGRSVRKAQCVVSGVQRDLQRHHIVPYCYRSHFPSIYKSKNHHDVVLIEHDLHAEYEIEAMKYKDELAEIYGVKKISEFNKAYSQLLREFNREKIISLSKLNAIFQGYGKLSEEIIYDNLKYVSEHADIDFNFLKKVNYIQLMKLYKILQEKYNQELNQFKTRHAQFYDHGWHLVKKLDTDEKIETFVKMWRQHFIDTMNPQYMPDGWSIDFRHKTRV